MAFRWEHTWPPRMSRVFCICHLKDRKTGASGCDCSQRVKGENKYVSRKGAKGAKETLATRQRFAPLRETYFSLKALLCNHENSFNYATYRYSLRLCQCAEVVTAEL